MFCLQSVSTALLSSGENLIQGDFTWSSREGKTICGEEQDTWNKTPIVTARFKEIVLIIVLDEWQRAIFSKLGLLHYLMLIDLTVRVRACVTVGPNAHLPLWDAWKVPSALVERQIISEHVRWSVWFGFLWPICCHMCPTEQGVPQREEREERAAEWEVCLCPQIAVASTDSTY